MIELFVYGTLMEGEQSGGLLSGCPSTPARARGDLFRLPAGYPAMVPLPPSTPNLHGDTWVHGELRLLEDPRRLSLLDTFEGVDRGLYKRVKIQVNAESRGVWAWTWVMTPEQIRAKGGVKIKGGDWKRISPKRGA